MDNKLFLMDGLIAYLRAHIDTLSASQPFLFTNCADQVADR